ncbi:neuronal acetylcholine receptor subunit alpha-7-like [Crassostrea virginica]
MVAVTFLLPLYLVLSRLGVLTFSIENQLFDHYSSSKKPRINQSDLVEVNIYMTIQTVLDVDERFQSISFYGWFKVQWQDEFLTWDETEFHGVRRIKVPYHKVWIPDIALYYSEKHIHDLGVHPFVTVTSAGHMTWFPGAKYTVQCHMNVKKFPFDEQKCSMVVGAWQTTDWMQKIVPRARSKNGAKEIAENGEWEFQSFTYEETYDPEFNLTKIIYTLRFRRRYRYFLLCTIMPIVILAVLNSLTFLIPVESGERIQYCLTLFLTFTVFLTLFDQTMPRNSTDVPFITVFVTFHLFLCVISTVVSIVTISIQLKSDEVTRVVPSENSDVLRMDHDQRDQCQEYWKSSPRKTFSRSNCKEVILNKIDTFMLVTNFILLGISAFILTIFYLS